VTMSDAATPREIERDLAFALQIAKAAGERVMRLRASARWEGSTLADIGDQAADGFLQGFLRGRHPDDGLLSEETCDSPERLAKRRTWIVDPLDGTKEYSEGRDDWAIHVALTFDGRPALGAVTLPAQDKAMWGVSLPGLERSGLEGEGRLVRGDSKPQHGVRVVMSRSHTPPWMERFCAEIGSTESVRSGSVGNKVARLLLGDADVYVHKKGLKEWDTCAPEVIARALGWSVCKLSGEEHVYNQRDYKNQELVVCRPALLPRVLAALGACGALVD
jgi:3'(2'), 5'-bisphosphate nucleotidase